MDAARARHRGADRDAVAHARAGAGLRRRARQARTDRAAHAPDIPLHPPDFARLPPRRGAELALSLRRGGGDADPAQSLPDRRPARARTLDRDARACAGGGRHGRRHRSVRLVDRRRPARGNVAPPASAPAHARGQAPADSRRAGGARRRCCPDQSRRRHHHRLASAQRLGLLSLLRRPRESTSARRRRSCGRNRAAAAAEPPAAGGRERTRRRTA